MTEYSKKIFEDSDLLHKKLIMYFGSIDAANKYLLLSQMFFAKGGKAFLKFDSTWNWFAFIFSPLFLLCRRMYFLGFVVIPFIFMPNIILNFIYPGLPGEIGKIESVISGILLLFVPVIIGMSANYLVIKRFEKFLDMQNDQLLINKGSLNIVGGILLFVISVALGGSLLPNSSVNSDNELENALMQKEAPKEDNEPGFLDKLANDWENEVNRAFGGGSARSNMFIVEFLPGVAVVGNSVVKTQELAITSNVDSVKVISVSVNKGNCLSVSVDRTLKFGESLKYSLRCKPLQVDIKTYDGDMTFKF